MVVPLPASIPSSRMHTGVTRIWVNEMEHQKLMELAGRLARARHRLFKRWIVQGETLAAVKRDLLRTVGISSRQFNAVRFEVQQEVAAWRGRTTYLKSQAEHRVRDLEQRWVDLDRAITAQAKVLSRAAQQRQRAAAEAARAWMTASIVPIGTVDKKEPDPAASRKIKPATNFATKSSAKSSVRSLSPVQAYAAWREAGIKLRVLKAKRQRVKEAQERQAHQLARLIRALAGPPSICFGGSRSLASAQRQLDQAQATLTKAAKTPVSPARQHKIQQRIVAAKAALATWKFRRTSRFTLIGSKDEVAGNASAIYDPSAQTLTVALWPEAGVSRLPRLNLQLEPQAFARQNGQALLRAAMDQAVLHRCSQMQKQKQQKRLQKQDSKQEPPQEVWPKGLGIDPPSNTAINPDEASMRFSQTMNEVSPLAVLNTTPAASEVNGGAITWRFQAEPKHDDPVKGRAWRVAASFTVEAAVIQTHRAMGALGVDVNADHLACTVIDRFGNATQSWTLPFPEARDGLSTGQQRAVVEASVKALCDQAQRRGLPVVIETLDFQRKKASLRALGPGLARMLSGWAYRQFQAALAARAAKAGVEVIEVNPAYTSVIGRIKYQARRPRWTVHQAAAGVIARRGMGYTERVAFPAIVAGPARNQPRSVWNRWRHVHVSEPGDSRAVNGFQHPRRTFARQPPTLRSRS